MQLSHCFAHATRVFLLGFASSILWVGSVPAVAQKLVDRDANSPCSIRQGDQEGGLTGSVSPAEFEALLSERPRCSNASLSVTPGGTLAIHTQSRCGGAG